MNGGTPVSGHVEAIFLALVGGEPMLPIGEALAVAGRGLKGDRYGEGLGSFGDDCQVTLIEAEHLEAIVAATGLHLLAGEHRRNIVTRGVDHAALAGRIFRIGGAVLAYRELRPPCAYLTKLTEPGMSKALGTRAGICVDVIEGGMIRIGDALIAIGDAPSG